MKFFRWRLLSLPHFDDSVSGRRDDETLRRLERGDVGDDVMVSYREGFWAAAWRVLHHAALLFAVDLLQEKGRVKDLREREREGHDGKEERTHLNDLGALDDLPAVKHRRTVQRVVGAARHNVGALGIRQVPEPENRRRIRGDITGTRVTDWSLVSLKASLLI